MKRRDLLVGTGMMAGLPRTFAASSRVSGKALAIETPFMRLECSPETGLASIYFRSGRPLLENATAAVVFPRGDAFASDGRYVREARLEPSTLPGIAGQTLVLRCRDGKRQVDIDWKMTLLPDREGAIFEAVLANPGKEPVQLRSSEPVRALLDENAGCSFSARRVLTHGYMHHDPGGLMELGTPMRAFTSWFNVALYRQGAALVAGFLDNNDGEGQIVGSGDMTRPASRRPAGFNLQARSLYNRHFWLPAASSISSGRVLLLHGGDPFEALEYFAGLFGSFQNVKLDSMINGWCSWFYTQLETNEDEQVRNAEFIAKHLKPYGMEWVQIDDGYQREFGDWEGNERFPHGMKWLAGRIRELGLKPGLWISPNVVSPNSDIARRHPEWLVHDAQDALQAIPNGRMDKPAYALDVTHPGARKWLHDLFRTIRHDWGYEFIKIDFPGWTILAAERYYDLAATKARAYRLFWRTIREAVGPDCHLLECGPGSVSAGLIDSMRIEQDSGLLFWQHYAKRFNSNAPAAAIRYYFHKRAWINDADHLGLALMTLEEGRAAASVIALSGGTMISGDRLTHLDRERLEILKKVLPSYGEAARPLDLFDKQFPEIFALRVKRDFGEWSVVGLFNWDERDTATRQIELTRLGLPGSSFLCYDFWSQRLVEPANARLTVAVEPRSVRLVAIRPATGVPALLGTDRHFTQGGVELEDVRWDAERSVLSGIATGVRETPWTLTVHLPSDYAWLDGHSHYFKDGKHDSAVHREPGILRIHFDFGESNRVPWSFAFRRK